MPNGSRSAPGRVHSKKPSVSMTSTSPSSTTSLVLDDGDVLVMLTDGFFEWTRPGADREPFGIPRLQDALRESASTDAATILKRIDHAVRAFCDGSPQSDDMTAIVIKRTAPAIVRARSGGDAPVATSVA